MPPRPIKTQMRSLRDFKGGELRWTQSKLMHRHYELKSGDDLFATLTWQKTVGSLAIGKFAEGEYSFKRGGFLKPYVSIRKLPFDTDYAKLEMGFGYNGAYQSIEARSYTFHKLSFWKSQWGFTDTHGKLLCTIAEKFSGLKASAEVRLEVDSRTVPNFCLLLILG